MVAERVPMDIGIATLHYGYNEGAILQTRALTELLADRFTSRGVRVIDQRYPRKLDVYARESNARTRALQSAIDDWLPLSDERPRTDDISSLVHALNGSFAAMVVGSDVVWDLHYIRRCRRWINGGLFPHQPDPFFPAFPNVYWPDERVRILKMSYAASVGSLAWEDVPAGHRRHMRRILSDFQLLSVRDERSHEFIDRLDPHLGQRTEIIPDPTLSWNLIDESRDEPLRRMLSAAGVDFSRPRIGLISSDTPAIRESVARLRQRGFQIVGISTPNDSSDVRLFDCALHPLDWARVFHFMDVCLVDRMHATIFCLLNHVPFIVLDKRDTEDRTGTKIKSLIHRFGLEPRRFVRSQVLVDELTQAVAEASTDTWDWSAVDRVVGHARRQADLFLDRMRDCLAAHRPSQRPTARRSLVALNLPHGFGRRSAAQGQPATRRTPRS